MALCWNYQLHIGHHPTVRSKTMSNQSDYVKLMKLILVLALVGLMSLLLILTSYSSSPSVVLLDINSKANPSHLAGQSVSIVATKRPDQATQSRVNEAYGKLPLSFEANQGQTDSKIKFLSHGSGYSLFLTSNEAVLALSKPTTNKTRKESIAALITVEAKRSKTA